MNKNVSPTLINVSFSLDCDSVIIHFKMFPCYVRPCHHGVAVPRVADAGDGLKMWTVAANTLKHPTRDGRPAWGLSEGLTTP